MKRYIPAVILLLSLILLPKSLVQAGAIHLPQAAGISMVSPPACPGNGCAAGQRLSLRVDFPVSQYNPAANPNLQLCVYTITAWNATNFLIDPQGGVTGAAYITTPPDATAACEAPPANYSLTGGAISILPANAFGDSLNFSLRIGKSAVSNGTVLVYVSEQFGQPAAWTRTSNAFTSINVIPASTTVYVANSPTFCGVNFPCFVDSAGDFQGGLGTGLKDAVDAVAPNSILNILGSYSLKNNTVSINQPLTVQGLNNAGISYAGNVCANPMLSLEDGITLRNLSIDGGTTCPDVRRDLLSLNTVNKTVDIFLDSNDFTHGKNAIMIADQAGNVVVRFNNLTGNTGQAIVWNPGTSYHGILVAAANNIFGNQAGAQVECNNHGDVNHNYWGSGILPAAAASHCTVADGKRLGAPIQHRSSLPGADAIRAPAMLDKTYYFNNQIGLQRSNDGPDYDVYIVNHGYGSNQNVPFQGAGAEAVSPCSNYWDIFLPDNVTPSAALNVFFKYDYVSTGCIDTVKSTSYCGQTTNQALYPLFWFEPAANVTNGWEPTGRDPTGSGANSAPHQTTSCDLTNKEIQINLDNSGRPNLSTDLHYIPFVVGIQNYLTPTPTRTSTPTPTITLTRTRTPTWTPSRTPTRYVPSSTPTRIPTSTPIRNLTLTPTPIRTSTGPTLPGYPGPGLTLTPTGNSNGGYPAPSTDLTATLSTTLPPSSYPAPGQTQEGTTLAQTTPGTAVTETATPSPAVTPSPPSPTPTVNTPNTIPKKLSAPPKRMISLSLILGGLMGLSSVLTAGWYVFLHRIQ